MRSSNWDEGLNFHFRMMVHKMATPPMLDAITISTVIVVRLADDDVSACCGAADAVAEAAAPAVCVTVFVVLASEVGSRGLTLRVAEGWLAEAEDELVDELFELLAEEVPLVADASEVLLLLEDEAAYNGFR